VTSRRVDHAAAAAAAAAAADENASYATTGRTK